MLQAFMIVFREGFESFLIVAITLAYLRKSRRLHMVVPVYWGITASILTSAGLGFWLWKESSGPVWEGIFGVVSAFLVAALVIHMWKTAPHLKRDMEDQLTQATSKQSTPAAWLAVFLFTVFMITREGMETALLLIQIHSPEIVSGMLVGLGAATMMAFLWVRFSHLINLKLFFQVTSIYLLLFVVQVLIYSFHEFTEARIFLNSEALHTATEPFSPEGLYGKWFSLVMVGICALWLLGAALRSLLTKRPPPLNSKSP